jgi:hypothetical protein
MNIPTDAAQVHFLKADLSAGRPRRCTGACSFALNEKDATAESEAV